MLYRVQKLNIDGKMPDIAETSCALFFDGALESVEECGQPMYGHDHVVLVHFPNRLGYLYCLGTIDTFATPWKPERVIDMRTASDMPEIQYRRTKTKSEVDALIDGLISGQTLNVQGKRYVLIQED